MDKTEREAVVTEFIRSKGVTHCPTACVSTTQASIGSADRAALEEHAIARARLRRAKAASRARSLWVLGLAN